MVQILDRRLLHCNNERLGFQRKAMESRENTTVNLQSPQQIMLIATYRTIILNPQHLLQLPSDHLREDGKIEFYPILEDILKCWGVGMNKTPFVTSISNQYKILNRTDCKQSTNLVHKYFVLQWYNSDKTSVDEKPEECAEQFILFTI